MRADVKLGIVVGIVVVSIAGGYFAFRGKPEKPIQIAAAPDMPSDRAASKAATPAGTDRASKPSTTPNRTPSRSASTPRNGGAGRSPAAPNTQPLASSDGATAPASTPPMVPGAARSSSPAPSERVADAKRDTPAGEAPVTVPQTGSEPPMTMPLAGSTNAKLSPSAPAPAANVTTLADTSKPASNTPAGGMSATEPQRPTPVPLTARAPAPAEAGKANAADTDAAVDTHRAQAGDTMTSLAERYYGDPALAGFLASSNPQLQEPTRLQPGQIVKIPPRPKDERRAGQTPVQTPPTSPAKTPPGGVAKTPATAKTYTVKPGDSFYKIARDHLGSAARWKELHELNKQLVGNDPTRLKPGQVLTLPNS